jgi:phosphoribosylformylglycinamidine cyclo-ligase
MASGFTYRSLGVSASKEDVLAAARLQGPGLFPGAFCKLLPDLLGGDPAHCVAIHSDGAGTKSVVAYLLFRETGDPTVFGSLAQDALVMNVDDLLCVGSTGPFLVSNTIGRHRELVPAEAVAAVVEGYERCASVLAEHGVEVGLCGGETADVGDVVRTILVDASVSCRMRRDAVLDGSAVAPGDAIVALGSAGQARYEGGPNSGIGSNGLTLARHALLGGDYRTRHPEACAPDLPDDLAYRGPFELGDRPAGLGMTVGEALLSPTRTYAPVVVRALKAVGRGVHAIVHCTGGGQTKCLRLGTGVRFVKDAMLEVPRLFDLIQRVAGVDWEEMYRVFNMGHRMELLVDPAAAGEVVDIARGLGVPAGIAGRCEPPGPGSRLRIEAPAGVFEYGSRRVQSS